MRIISGSFRRKRIQVPKNFKARPTTDIAKEGLFNIVDNEIDISKTKVLDLFGGTGSISYEFVSRGCADVTCVELNYNHYKFIKNTIDNLNIGDQMRVIKANAFSFIRQNKNTYDFIFADPPYSLKEIESIPSLIFDKNLLSSNGVLIVEHSSQTSFTNANFFQKQKTYGSVNFSFFTKN